MLQARSSRLPLLRLKRLQVKCNRPEHLVQRRPYLHRHVPCIIRIPYPDLPPVLHNSLVRRRLHADRLERPCRGLDLFLGLGSFMVTVTVPIESASGNFTSSAPEPAAAKPRRRSPKANPSRTRESKPSGSFRRALLGSSPPGVVFPLRSRTSNRSRPFRQPLSSSCLLETRQSSQSSYRTPR